MVMLLVVFSLQSLILWFVVDKCGQCSHNCGSSDPKNFALVAEIAIAGFRILVRMHIKYRILQINTLIINKIPKIKDSHDR